MSGQPSRNLYRRDPRHGRIPSISGTQPFVRPQSQMSQGPSPPSASHRALPTVTRSPVAQATDLQRWSREQLVPFLRWAYAVRDEQGNAHPNYNYDSDINNAIHISETIDSFDVNAALANELILRITSPDLGHSSMDWIIRNRPLVEMLLYRHYQRHGGLVLPPRQSAVTELQGHERAVQLARQVKPGLHPDEYPRVNLPRWQQ